jgi:hypothetical protein
MSNNDYRKIIAALVEKTGIKIDENDPAFAIVVLNQIMLESSASDAAKSIETAASKFNDAATAQADDFVAVANEALSKFTTKTNELRAAILNIHQTNPTSIAPFSAEERARFIAELLAAQPSRGTAAIVGVLIFLVGLVMGIAISFLL